MEQIIEKADAKKSNATRKVSTLKKLDLSSVKLLSQLKEKANKKTFGRKVREKEIIAVALKLVDDSHIMELQEQSLSGKDRVAIAHENYQKAYGKITFDQFMEKLLKGELKVNTNN